MRRGISEAIREIPRACSGRGRRVARNDNSMFRVKMFEDYFVKPQKIR